MQGAGRCYGSCSGCSGWPNRSQPAHGRPRRRCCWCVFPLNLPPRRRHRRNPLNSHRSLKSPCRWVLRRQPRIRHRRRRPSPALEPRPPPRRRATSPAMRQSIPHRRRRRLQHRHLTRSEQLCRWRPLARSPTACCESYAVRGCGVAMICSPPIRQPSPSGSGRRTITPPDSAVTSERSGIPGDFPP